MKHLLLFRQKSNLESHSIVSKQSLELLYRYFVVENLRLLLFSILLESLKFPNQHLTVTRRGTMGDPRTHDIDASKLFYAFCKVLMIF